MSTRPLVSVFDGSSANTTVVLPAVFQSPIRHDIVHYVHTLMAKNARQAYAVTARAGMGTAAASWGTGRAVARIPRVHGGGTSRAGQGAFGNMCRGGRMFAPTKVWRRWHKKINVNQRRYAVASALAATAIPALVMARGHRVDEVPEFPLVLSNSTNNVSSTKAAKTIMSAVGAMADIEKSADSRSIRAGSGKARNRRYVQRKGPLVIHSSNSQVVKCFRNLPGCDTASVENLSLLELAPGGHLGRFCVWVQDAFEKLDALFGDYENESTLKKGYTLPRTMMTNADLARLINSDEIQSLVKAPTEVDCVIPEKRNPLRRPEVKIGLNPYHALVKEREEKANSMSKDARGKALKKKRSAAAATSKKYKAQKKQFIANASQEGDIVF